MLDPNEPLTSHLNGEEAYQPHALLYIENVTWKFVSTKGHYAEVTVYRGGECTHVMGGRDAAT
jgi:hypothetical protein